MPAARHSVTQCIRIQSTRKL